VGLAAGLLDSRYRHLIGAIRPAYIYKKRTIWRVLFTKSAPKYAGLTHQDQKKNKKNGASSWRRIQGYT
jgi:hypothetical protein